MDKPECFLKELFFFVVHRYYARYIICTSLHHAEMRFCLLKLTGTCSNTIDTGKPLHWYYIWWMSKTYQCIMPNTESIWWVVVKWLHKNDAYFVFCVLKSTKFGFGGMGNVFCNSNLVCWAMGSNTHSNERWMH